MKQKIFNRGNGWYISATNYKDKEDRAYVNLFFPKNTEPLYQDNPDGYEAKDIDILDAKFTSFKGKVGMTIFKYTEIEQKEEPAVIHRKTDNMGGGVVEIDTDDLPFY